MVEFQDHQPEINRRVYHAGDAASIVGDRGGVRDDVVAPARIHRLLRRGRKYGDHGVPDGEQGLRFVFSTRITRANSSLCRTPG
jgi:hypothetical protein